MVPFLFLGLAAADQNADSPSRSVASLATWPRNAPAAFSITFDDDFSNQYTLAYPILTELNVRATFFVITKYLDRRLYGVGWDEFRAMSQAGHEIESHSEYHPDFSKLDSGTALAELQNSQKTIEKQLPGKRCLFLAWPYGKSSPLTRKIAARFYLAARGVGERPSGPRALDVYSIDASGEDGTFIAFMDSVKKDQGWLIRVVHRVGDSAGQLPVSRLREQLLAAIGAKYWIAPFGEAYMYAKARDSARVESAEATDSSQIIRLTSPLSDTAFGFPLTLRVRLPRGWGDAEVLQGSRPVWHRFLLDGGQPWLETEAIPNSADILVRRTALRSDSVPATIQFPAYLGRIPYWIRNNRDAMGRWFYFPGEANK